jgi:hypothetical protein
VDAHEEIRLTLAAPDVEVITLRAADGTFQTILNGGRLDGDRFTTADDPDAQHDAACLLVRGCERGRRS